MSEKKKKLSGYQNLLNKRKREEELEKHVKITQFFLKPESTLPDFNTSSSRPDTNTSSSRPDTDTSSSRADTNTSSSNIQQTHLFESMPSTSSSSTDNGESITSNVTTTESICQLSKDVALWPTILRPSDIQELVELGPTYYQNKKDDYPRDNSGRKFRNSYFFRILPNKEKTERFWLLYSESKNSVYCFCCKVFTDGNLKSLRLSDKSGYNDWKHLGEHLNIHETSKLHIENVLKLLDLANRFNKNQVINSEIQNVINRETKYWHAVIERIFYVIQFLAEQNLAFRGSSSKLFEKGNGNFLKCIEMISKFDPIMSEHTTRSQLHDNKYNNNYLGDKIQNEVINLIGENIKSKIIELAKKAKYFSILLDCTPDSSHQEQISVCIRFVNLKSTGICIEEHFLLFCPIDDTSGEGLTEFLLLALKKEGLNINDLRGQSYDNGANMRGRHNGLQKRILDLNPRAFFVPCCNHSLNLVVNDAAKSNTLTTNFFSLVQQLFVFFSGSTKRWSILKSNVTNLTLKSLSDTRWASRIDAITPLRYQLGEVYDALFEISQGNFENSVKNLAISLANQLKNFEFVCILVVWYNILSKVNIASKVIQNPNFDVAQCCIHLNNLNTFLKAYRSDKGFNDLLIDAKEIATTLDIEPKFKKQKFLKPRKVKKHFDYECDDEPMHDENLKFKVDCFFNTLDVIITSVDERFQTLSCYSSNFEILWNIDKFSNYSEKEQLETCQKLENILYDKTRNERDINAAELLQELKYFQNFDKNVNRSPEEILNYMAVSGLIDCFPNTSILLRILLTMPVSVATAERSFSKLKLIKSYLRSTMGQNRLTNLAIISIESDILKELDTEDLIKQFARNKARKVQFI